MTIAIKTSGQHDLNVAVPAAVEKLERVAQRRVLQYAELLRDTAKVNVLALRDAGRPLPSTLAESIHLEPGEGHVIKVVVDAPHALFVEFGTSTQDPQPFLSMAVAEVRASAPLD